MNKIRIWLSHPRLPTIVTLRAVELTLPSRCEANCLLMKIYPICDM